MICSAEDLLGWGDFPKGLRVLLLDEDTISAAEIKSKLEEMDYIVSAFCNENEALSAISNNPDSFHVAIVEVSSGNSNGDFRFLESARDLPTIMISSIHCLSTMMKCIALGAAEFLQKPLSEEKLRNIWQHVVHKISEFISSEQAFNAGGNALSKSLNPLKETVVSMLQLQLDSGETENCNLAEAENVQQAHEHDHEQSTVSDKFPAPSTPQLKQGGRLLDDGDCQDQTNCSLEKESGEQEGESKSVETTCNNLHVEVAVKVDPSERPEEAVIKEEDDSADGSKTGANISPHPQNEDGVQDFSVEAGHCNTASPPNLGGTRASRKKRKLDWSLELHKRFVQAVEQLGVHQAIPSRILELMKEEGLTRHNVASHLQKYRRHRRHILPKEDDQRWQHLRDPVQRGYPHIPVMAFPPYHSIHGLAIATSQNYPVWGHPRAHPSGIPMWGPPGYPAWQPQESWLWKTYPGMHADTWGCHVMPPPQGLCSNFPQVSNADTQIHVASCFYRPDAIEDCSHIPKSSINLHPAEEEIDKVMKEAISKPWLPMPLGLKPPSTESILSELPSQGISNIPSPINNHHHSRSC
ncbi:hypothetical protein HHK36_028159 [Tetracentron sinense]|uniref:Two-component response regulator-like APRR2 n=1 Tax=Tetracentron sinense TaxID=13715 RepID=A0A834YG34_TETSI|nr:hypothetical protein HHK36_028159 [Tetracentron sinense]